MTTPRTDCNVTGIFEYTGVTWFTVVVLVETTQPMAGLEFAMTDLAFPPFRKDYVALLDGEPVFGEFPSNAYALDFDRCVPAGTTIAVRFRFSMWLGYWPTNLALQLRGLEAGDPHESRFGGLMGYFDCDGNGHVLTPVPWQEVGMAPDEDLAGGVLLNPIPEPVDLEARSMTTLKTRF